MPICDSTTLNFRCELSRDGFVIVTCACVDSGGTCADAAAAGVGANPGDGEGVTPVILGSGGAGVSVGTGACGVVASARLGVPPAAPCVSAGAGVGVGIAGAAVANVVCATAVAASADTAGGLVASAALVGIAEADEEVRKDGVCAPARGLSTVSSTLNTRFLLTPSVPSSCIALEELASLPLLLSLPLRPVIDIVLTSSSPDDKVLVVSSPDGLGGVKAIAAASSEVFWGRLKSKLSRFADATPPCGLGFEAGDLAP